MTVRRKQPIDATGLFWAFVLGGYGLFSVGISGPYGVPFLIGAALCLRWQFQIWSQQQEPDDKADSLEAATEG
jgi:hypothetical protein